MRQMPSQGQAALNPNDYTGNIKGGAGFQKKQFGEMNQHYFSHNAVLPGSGDIVPGQRTRNANPNASPYQKDPYANIAMKPNQMSIDSANQLQKQVTASTPAGVISDLRKSSPSGHQGTDAGRGVGQGSLGRAGQESSSRGGGAPISMNDYRMPEYGSIQKVVPKSRDQNPLGAADLNGAGSMVYSSKPGENYQSMSIEQSNDPQGDYRENFARQQEQAFMEEERNFARHAHGQDSIDMSHLPPTTIGGGSTTEDAGPIRDNFNAPAPEQQHMSRASVAMAEPNVGLSIGSNQRVNPNNRMRGRIHASNDVLNGISGMEHLSNSLANRSKAGASPAIMAQMRPSPYNHHASQPETVLMDQLKQVNTNNGGMTPLQGNAQPMNLKSSQSRGNLPSMPELEYDPWYANQQRYLAHQGAALNKQAHIYQKHMTDFTLRKQQDEERLKEDEKAREEARRTQAQQQLEQQKLYKAEMKNSYKSILDDQMNQNRMQKEIEIHEKAQGARLAQQRSELQRQQENQMRQLKVQQQSEYRQVLDGQKVTRGLGLQQIAGDPPGVGQARIRSGKVGSPSASVIKAYGGGSSGLHNSAAPQNLANGGNLSNNYSMPQMPGMAPAGVRRMPQF